MNEAIGSTKLHNRLTLLTLYEVDYKKNVVVIGIGNTPRSERQLRKDNDGFYFVHGCTKYRLTEFKQEA
jgi:hypothetical protein